MVSGKYSALSGAIAREQSLANVSENLANVSTIGYKKSKMSFESMLKGEKQLLETKGINYNRVRGNYIDISQGPMVDTGNTFDLAIMGEGFFKVRTGDGDLLTRKGNFLVDSENRLVTDTGHPVLGEGGEEIFITHSDINQVVVDENGNISSIGITGEKIIIGKVGIFSINDPSMLKGKNNTSFTVDNESLETLAVNFKISQGSLEGSNVNMVEEMTKMINDNRTYEVYHKVLKAYSTLGEKLGDLGTLA